MNDIWARLLAADDENKPGGRTYYDAESSKLAQLYERRARGLTYAHLRQLGIGDPGNTQPIEVALLTRIVDTLSVVYRTPATRRLVRNGLELEDDHPDTRAAVALLERLAYNLQWWAIDAARNLYRQVVVAFAESAEHARHGGGAAQIRIFEPHNVMRLPTQAAADLLDADEAFALRLTRGAPEGGPIDSGTFQLWERTPGGWTMHVVDESGAVVGAQPYGEAGTVPFAELPALVIYDSLPNGRAWLPLDSGRSSFALAVNGLVNDLAYLTKMEAHTTPALISDDPRGIPTDAGPGKVWVLPGGTTVANISRSPKILECIRQLEQTLELWAVSEGLDPGAFAGLAAPATAPALKVRSRDLDARRERQIPLAYEDERRAWRRLRAVYNAVSAVPLATDTELRVSIGRAWEATDPKELQAVAYNDLSIGAMSLIDYMQARFSDSREEAIRRLDRIAQDRIDYPAKNNPAALAPQGPRPATGEGGATMDDDEEGEDGDDFNPDRAASVERSSVVGAAIRATS